MALLSDANMGMEHPFVVMAIRLEVPMVITIERYNNDPLTLNGAPFRVSGSLSDPMAPLTTLASPDVD